MRPAALTALGILLFLFIPVVLFLFVRHPEPVGVSLSAGVALMLGHRFLALPYARRARDAKCIWCNRVLAVGAESARIDVDDGAARTGFVACPHHREWASRFFAWTDRLRLPLRLGIGVPLLVLLATLAAVALGQSADAGLATDLFRFCVGLTVNLAALGARFGRDDPTGSIARAAFPLHNFTLLGLRNLLWILRLVGLWWIVEAGAALAGRFGG